MPIVYNATTVQQTVQHAQQECICNCQLIVASQHVAQGTTTTTKDKHVHSVFHHVEHATMLICVQHVL